MASPLKAALAALLGLSTYAPAKGYGLELSDPEVEKIRESVGGNLAAQPTTQLRWFLADLEAAQHMADAGDLSRAARLTRAMKRDGTISGLMGSLTSGLVRLPKKFTGNPDICASLKSRNGTRSVFDDMFPPSELAQMAEDGRGLGVGVAEMLPVQGRSFPVMVRLEPEFLRYRWQEGRWYYTSIAGPLPITPGDGRWILHTPGGRLAPWMNGKWPALGRAFINKEHALLHRSNYGAKLANAARVAVSPQGASEPQKQAWFHAVMAWGVNTVFGMTPGYDVKLLESNGRGYDVFQADIDTSDREIMIAIAGQTVTADGGSGFINGDLFKNIRSDIIQDVAEGLAYTINTQGLPPYVIRGWGIDALETGAICEWDSTPPKDRQVEAQSLVTTSNAITQLGAALAPYGIPLEMVEIINRFGIPVGTGSVAVEADKIDPKYLAQLVDFAKTVGLRPTSASVATVLGELGITTESMPPAAVAAVPLTLAPTDVAKVIKGSEARASQGLGPFGDERDNMTVAQLGLPTPPPDASPSAAPAPAPSAEASPVAEMPVEAPPTDESAAQLAARMTALKIAKCEHGSSNRCRLCGVERVRDVARGDNDEPVWAVGWRAIFAA